MDFRRLPVLAGPVVAGLLVLGGCAGAPGPAPQVAPAPVAATSPAGSGQAPCTARLRPGGGAAPMTITPEAQQEIERLRAQPPSGQAGAAPDPALTSRLADVRERVERAARPCADR
ncbi:hypothetical protein [Actinomycetospora cinnamomea]|uniref:Uncharacterized protein n=1 Tax=Actinomycetospora cinnamomea TaxID=663609 RepID=A0A2U1E7G4_9PSEU|nr:hypothetical protein [Actinomycetospora cinnamomea]PVY95871.1 hypothetical protein C8D89_1357 [Actinomycetospora cinnamomea]